jgi:hypothetical protein
MAKVKEWLISNLDSFTDEQLRQKGWDDDDIELLREAYYDYNGIRMEE